MTEPTGTETSLGDLRDELSTGYDAAPDTALDAPPAADAPPTAAEAPPPMQLPPLEAPSVWGQPYKETFSQLAQSPEQRAVAERWLEQWKETQGYITKRDQEYADYRKRLDPIYQHIQPYEQYWQMQGLSAEQGVGRLMAYARALEENPAGMIPQLAQLYGVDLQQLVQEQPYQDPEVAALRQQIAELQQAQSAWSQQQQQQQQSRLTEEVRAFATATDEHGSPKHPHFDRVFDRMVGLAKGGLAQGLDDAYRMAVALDPDLQAEIAQQKAQQQAATLAAEAKRAQEASRTVRSSPAAEGTPPERGLRDDLMAAVEAAGIG